MNETGWFVHCTLQTHMYRCIAVEMYAPVAAGRFTWQWHRSTALHGLIAQHSYPQPNRPVVFSAIDYVFDL